MKRILTLVLVIMMGLSIAACGSANSNMTGSDNDSTTQGQQSFSQGENEPIKLQTQGSFAVGGTVITAPGTFDPIKQGAYNPAGPDSAGQTLHGDHAYVFYQIPEHARKLPLVFWHGYGQGARTWETTPDGREGFQNIFLRRNFSVIYLNSHGVGRLDAALLTKQSRPLRMNSFGSASSDLAFGRISITEFSSHVILKP